LVTCGSAGSFAALRSASTYFTACVSAINRSAASLLWCLAMAGYSTISSAGMAQFQCNR
jgi:hypothetical protein